MLVSGLTLRNTNKTDSDADGFGNRWEFVTTFRPLSPTTERTIWKKTKVLEPGDSFLVFWSDRAYAARHVKEGWNDYKATPIPLDVFLDRWLRGMHKDRILVGLNWDANFVALKLNRKMSP